MSDPGSFVGQEEEGRELLIRLLKSDEHVRQLVRDIGTLSAPSIVPVVKAALPTELMACVQHECPLDSLREQLAEALALLKAFTNDEELRAAWLHGSESEGQQLIRLVATAAQWERLLELWDLLASRCRSQARSASNAEQNILEGSLSIHNLIWRDRQAQLVCVKVGAEYDYRLHQRTTRRGNVITAHWLPGLENAGGECQRLPLVATE